MNKKNARLLWAGAAASVTALYGYYFSEGLKTPLPGLDQEVAEGLVEEMHEFETTDGAALKVKRYANPGATPVLFCHGFDGNGFEFDLPRRDRNIAVFLAGQGFDVWISSFRGCGREPYLCEGCDWRHSIDHLAIYDAPTLVDGIIEETGMSPFWIGHSMGGMILYMYLQGARFADDRLVVSDPDLVEERSGKLAGGIPIASPPAFWWPRLHPFQVFTGSGAGRSLLGASIMYMRARGALFPRFRVGSRILRLFGSRPRALKALSRSPLGLLLYCRRNTDCETTTSLIRWGADDVSAGMFVQLVDGVRNTHFRQYFPVTFKHQPYDYTMGMPLIRTPMLFVTGDKDFANWAGIKRYGYDRISSREKEIVTLPGYGHTDLVMGRNAHEDVYPVVLEWMEKVARPQEEL
jgi:lysosomal acid lipase/cholesteryl ester hydrolase